MEQGRFARYLFLVVLVVAVVGLLNSGFLEVTGFAAKKTPLKKAVTAVPALGRQTAPAPAAAPQPEGAKCGSGVSCVAGLECFKKICQRVTCEDTDAANDPAVQGTASVTASISGPQFSRSDVCDGALLKQVDCPNAKYGRSAACPEGTGCENGACASLCGNARADPAENCGICPADAPCGAGQECSNNACVALCGNGRVDEGETCSSCAGDVRCAAGQQCRNGQCVVQPFCRDLGYVRGVRQNLSTHEGNYTVYTCRDDMTSAQRGCQGAAVVEISSTPCRNGCNQTDGTCCYGRPVRTECSSPESGINVSFSACLNREVQFPFTCGQIRMWWGGSEKTFTAACSADVQGCIPCGLRTCVHRGDWGTETYLVNNTAGQDCRAGDSGFDAAC